MNTHRITVLFLVAVVVFLVGYIVWDSQRNSVPVDLPLSTLDEAIAATSTSVVEKNSQKAVAPPSAKAVSKPAPIAHVSAAQQPAGVGTFISGCQIFPQDNSWNTDISSYPVHTKSAAYISSIGSNRMLHADFGGDGEYGIPFVVVPNGQAKTPVVFTDYGDESDPGPYPIPLSAPVEGGASATGDRHVLALALGECKLYELFNARPTAVAWEASSGAVFNLASNALRPDYWTSADAAGLPILPGLVRYDEVVKGVVTHALRFTARRTQKGFIHPATHFASSSSDPNVPPMGLRVRLKASYDTTHFTGQAKVILEGMKKYGLILADNGSDWFITGAADTRWNDDDLNQLKTVPGSAFEAVDTGSIIH